jgi:hypothetical protein
MLSHVSGKKQAEAFLFFWRAGSSLGVCFGSVRPLSRAWSESKTGREVRVLILDLVQ